MRTALALLLGVVMAACVPQVGADPVPSSSGPPPTTATPATTTTVITATTATTTTTTAVTAPSTTTAEEAYPAGWFVAWVSGGLPDGFAAGVASIDGIDAVSEVGVGLSHLVASATSTGERVDAAPDGFAYPLETFVIDVGTFGASTLPSVAAQLVGMRSDEVALGASSARLRRLGVGDTMTFQGGEVAKVSAILPDDAVGYAELVVTRASRVLASEAVSRFVVFHGAGELDALEAAVSAIGDEPVRVVARDEATLFRHAETVLPQISIKEWFGEFAYRPGSGDRFTIDPAWVENNIVTVALPLLGETVCHRTLADLLREAMNRLIALGASDVIDPADFAGCWNPRFIADRKGISRHAWGAAADMNIFNPLGGPNSPVDPTLLSVMHGLGFTDGADWLAPDPGHFEWYGSGP